MGSLTKNGKKWQKEQNNRAGLCVRHLCLHQLVHANVRVASFTRTVLASRRFSRLNLGARQIRVHPIASRLLFFADLCQAVRGTNSRVSIGQNDQTDSMQQCERRIGACPLLNPKSQRWLWWRDPKATDKNSKG